MRDLNVYRSYGFIGFEYINEFENKIEFIFPESYKKLISKNNALSPEEADFDFYDLASNSKDTRDITFYGYGDSVSENYNIAKQQNFDAYGHEGVIAFGCCSNGDHVCFDYRDKPTGGEPKVVVMFHDCADENNKMLVCPVAENFERFVNSLYKYEED